MTELGSIQRSCLSHMLSLGGARFPQFLQNFSEQNAHILVVVSWSVMRCSPNKQANITVLMLRSKMKTCLAINVDCLMSLSNAN